MADPAASPIDPDDILRRTFTSVRRGLDPLEVQKFLLQLATELRTARERERELQSRLDEAERNVEELTEMAPGRLSSLVGEETSRILEAANSAAADIRARAEEKVAALLREAQDEAQQMRQEASRELGRRQEEGAELLAEAKRQVDEIVQQARADAEEAVEAGRQRGREMFVEAQRVRERVLRDLARRRKQLRQQIEQLQAGRERLAAAYDVVRETLDVATEELRVMEPEAKLAAEAAALRAAEEDAHGESFEQEMAALVSEVEGESGHDSSGAPTGSDDEGEDSAAALEAGPAPDLEPEAVFDVELDAEEPQPEPEPGPEPATDLETAAEGSDGSLDAPEADEDGKVEEGEHRDELDERDEVLNDLTRALGRAVKRSISDEQNEVLDLVRRKERDLEDLLPTPEAHVERMAAAMIPPLTEAAAAGARLDGAADTLNSSAIQDIAAEVAVELVVPLRERLEQCVAESGDDNDVLVERLRDSYREWRTQKVDQVAARAVLIAFNRGVLDPAVP